jgi:hypothetical protein
MNEWKVFRVSDVDWWLARSFDEAVADYEKQGGDWEPGDVRALTDDEMDKLRYHDSSENGDAPIGRGRTFRRELANRVAAGLSAPELFATTEL